MSTKVKKILASFLIAIYLTFNALAPVANAQSAPAPQTSNSTWYSQSFTDWYAKVYGGADDKQIFGERYTAAQVQWVFYGFFAMIVNYFLYQRGCTPTDVANLFQGNASAQSVKCLTSYNPMQNKSSDLAGKNLLELVFADRPLSGITYFKKIIRKFHLIPEANAQSVSPGFGYGALQPVQQLWTASRNISYGLFVLVILALAFMIMFRVKISPQAAITAQSALPKIAVALIIVTFSYAIAGFLIDLMYVVIALLSLIFSGSGFFSSNPVELFGYFTRGFFDTGVFGFLILYLGQFVITFILTGVGLGYGLFGQPGLNGAVAGAAIIGGVFALLAVVVLVIMIIILIWIALRIIWTLIKAFAYILFLTIILPLQVTVGVVVPGLGFGSWLKLYISNLAVFPITATLFAISFIFMEQSRKFVEQTITAGELGQFVHVTPAQFTPGWPPLLGVSVGTISLVFLMISFFILSLIPKAAEVASGLISGKFNFGSHIGEATNPFGLRGLVSETAGTYLGNQLYNPRGGTGAIPAWVNRIRTGRGRPLQPTQAGTGPTLGSIEEDDTDL